MGDVIITSVKWLFFIIFFFLFQVRAVVAGEGERLAGLNIRHGHLRQPLEGGGPSSSLQLHPPSSTGSHSFNSFAIFDAMFLNPIDVPEIRLKRTPFNESRGSLQTSISHWTSESVFGSPWMQSKRNLSLCSYSQLLASNTWKSKTRKLVRNLYGS